jgi:DNA-binding transcriptional LysR family regulator
MNITVLQTFVAIVETGSLVRASEKLSVTQSTVTARLKALEDTLGQTLINRQKSGATLTPAGAKLLRYARIMPGLWRQATYETRLPAELASVCTFACNRELWHGPGRAFLNAVASARSETALSIRQGGARELEAWLGEGLVDVILTFGSAVRVGQTAHRLPAEEIALFSSRPDSPVKGDPIYIDVDHGEAVSRAMAEDYHDAGVARIGFDTSWWALQYMMDCGGSAYLPRALADDYVAQGRVHLVSDAPVYKRTAHLLVNDTAARNWAWFAPLLDDLGAEPASGAAGAAPSPSSNTVSG